MTVSGTPSTEPTAVEQGSPADETGVETAMGPAAKSSEVFDKAALRELGLGAAWLVGIAAVVHIVETLVAQNPLAGTVAAAVIVDLAAGRAGVRWDHPGLENEPPKAIAQRVLKATAAPVALLLVVLGVGAAAGLATVQLGHPDWPLFLAFGRAIAIAIRAEMLLRGVVFLTAQRARVSPLWAVIFSALASAALLLLSPFATLPAFAFALTSGALFAVIWLRFGGAWAAIGAHTVWSFLLASGLRGGLFDVVWTTGSLSEGPRAVGPMVWWVAGLQLALSVILWRVVPPITPLPERSAEPK